MARDFQARPTRGPVTRPRSRSGGAINAILVVDDSAAIRQLLQATLQAGGFDVIATADGAAALAFLRESRVDLVVTDINMPHMDGIQLIEHVRRDPGHAAVPILVLSGESGRAERDRATAAGASAWLSKPFTVAKLLSAIRRLEAGKG